MIGGLELRLKEEKKEWTYVKDVKSTLSQQAREFEDGTPGQERSYDG